MRLEVELPSSARRASSGKSSAGRWSPPCETRMRDPPLEELLARSSVDASRPAGDADQHRGARPDAIMPERLLRTSVRRADDVEDEVDRAPALASSRRAELRAPARASAASRSMRAISRSRPRCRAPWTTQSPTAPQPMTATRAPPANARRVQHRADAGRDRAADQACLLGGELGRHLDGGDGGDVRARRERADAQDRCRTWRRRARAAARARRGGLLHRRGSPRTQAGARAARACASRARPDRRRASPSTPSPTASTAPAPSCPSSTGSGMPQPSSSIDVQVAVADAARVDAARAPRPGPGSSSGSPRARPLSGRAQRSLRWSATNESRSRTERAAGEREREVDLGHQVAGSGPRRPAARRPRARRRTGGRAGRRPRRAPSPSARRRRFGCRRPRARPPSRPAPRAPRRGVERRDRAVDLAAAVVRDDDPVDAVRERARASSAVSTPLTRSGSVVCSRSQSRSSHVEAEVGEGREHRRGRREQVLLGGSCRAASRRPGR